MKRFIITLVPVPGVDGIRALRAVLKTALRRHGLRAIDAREEMTPGRINDRHDVVGIPNHTQVFTELRHGNATRRAARTPPHHEQEDILS